MESDVVCDRSGQSTMEQCFVQPATHQLSSTEYIMYYRKWSWWETILIKNWHSVSSHDNSSELWSWRSSQVHYRASVPASSLSVSWRILGLLHRGLFSVGRQGPPWLRHLYCCRLHFWQLRGWHLSGKVKSKPIVSPALPRHQSLGLSCLIEYKQADQVLLLYVWTLLLLLHEIGSCGSRLAHFLWFWPQWFR